MKTVTQADTAPGVEGEAAPESDEIFEAWAIDSIEPDETPLWAGGTETRALLLLAAHSLSVFFGVTFLVACMWLTHRAFTNTPAGVALNVPFAPGGVVIMLCGLIQAFLLPQLIAGARVFSIGRVYMLTDRRVLIGRLRAGRIKTVRAVELDGATDIARFAMHDRAWMIRIFREGGRSRRILGPTGIRRFRPPQNTLLDLPAVEDAEELERELIEEVGLPRVSGPGVLAAHLATPEEDREYHRANDPENLEDWQRAGLESLLVDGERVIAAQSHSQDEETYAARVLESVMRGVGYLLITVLTGLVLAVAIESAIMLVRGSAGTPSGLWMFATTGNVFAVAMFWTAPTLFFHSVIASMAPKPRAPHLSVITDLRCIASSQEQVRSYGSASAKHARAKLRSIGSIDFCDTVASSMLLPATDSFANPLTLKEPRSAANFIRRAFAGEEKENRPD